MIALAVVEGFVILLLGVLVVGLLRSHAEILRRLHELGAGLYDEDSDSDGAPRDVTSGVTTEVALGEAPDIRTRPGVPEPRGDETPAFDIAGLTPTGSSSVIGVVGTGRSTLLAFLSSGCGTCAGFWQAFARGEADSLPGRDTRLVIITKGPENESVSAVRDLAPPGTATLMSDAAHEQYGVPVSPYFILVDGVSNKVVGEGAAGSWEQVANLLRQAAADAGVPTEGSAGPRRGRLDGKAREARADTELAAAGIGPGHASLYPDASPAEAGPVDTSFADTDSHHTGPADTHEQEG